MGSCQFVSFESFAAIFELELLIVWVVKLVLLERLLLKLRYGPIGIMPVLQETSHCLFDVASDFF